MAVVAEYKFRNCTVSVHDDAYAGVSETEMERRIREVQRTAWRIWESQRLRSRGEDNDTSSARQSRAPSPQGEGIKRKEETT